MDRRGLTGEMPDQTSRWLESADCLHRGVAVNSPDVSRMEFHNYRTLRNRSRARSMVTKWPEEYRQATSKTFRQLMADRHMDTYRKAHDEAERETALTSAASAIAEQEWTESERPFYNVWPIAMELATSVRLDLKFSKISRPPSVILFRFAKGHEPNGVSFVLVQWDIPQSDGSRAVRLYLSFVDLHNISCVQHVWMPDDRIEEWLTAFREYSQTLAQKFQNTKQEAAYLQICQSVELLIRLVAFIGLLATGDDAITPAVLAKDRSKYNSTSDPDLKKWLENRAARVMGRGFDLGKNLEAERAKSPHWRNPHPALFWIGEGRDTPIIKLRSGSIVHRASMADVPTGWLGPEMLAEDDENPDSSGATRPAIPKSKRFAILKRDGYRCQLCGRSPQDADGDGVKLHVDHKIARVNGGGNEDENLWTLCQDCNLGKSDGEL